MIIRGGARKDGTALADYLTTEATKKNDNVTILEIKNGATQDIHKALFDMDVAVELTNRGKKSLYQSTINPAYGEDRQMSNEDWFFAADILENELGFTGQNRVIVLHEKKGRVHAHVIWQREREGKLIQTSHNYKKHDVAREKIEIALKQNRTLQPKDIKQTLSSLWYNSVDAKDFITKAEAMGFKIGIGEKRAYVVQTPDGQKLDLVRQLDKVKTYQVKERLKNIESTLAPEKELNGQERKSTRKNERSRRQEEAFEKRGSKNKHTQFEETAQQAGETFADITARTQPKRESNLFAETMAQFHDNKINREETIQQTTQNFEDITAQKNAPEAANDNTVQKESDFERIHRKLKEQREKSKQKDRGKEKGLEM